MIDVEASAALLDSALGMIQQSGEIALEYFRSQPEIENKAGNVGFDPVTEADKRVEAYLRGEIARLYPHHGVIGEEHEDHNPEAATKWIIDPIDGTRAFMSGMPTWGTLLGLIHEGRSVLGLMHQPYLGETFFAGPHGAHLLRASHRSPIATRAARPLDQAVMFSTHPDYFGMGKEKDAFERVAAAVRLSCYGGDCYNYCMVAMGQIDLVVEACLNPHDIVPLIPIVERAGGVVTTWDGGDAHAGGSIVAASSPELHAEAVALLR